MQCTKCTDSHFALVRGHAGPAPRGPIHATLEGLRNRSLLLLCCAFEPSSLTVEACSLCLEHCIHTQHATPERPACNVIPATQSAQASAASSVVYWLQQARARRTVSIALQFAFGMRACTEPVQRLLYAAGLVMTQLGLVSPGGGWRSSRHASCHMCVQSISAKAPHI